MSYLALCLSFVSKTATQRLENWKMVLCGYDYVITYIAGDSDGWGNLLSGLVNVSCAEVWSIAVIAGSKPGDKMSSNNVTHEARL